MAAATKLAVVATLTVCVAIAGYSRIARSNSSDARAAVGVSATAQLGVPNSTVPRVGQSGSRRNAKRNTTLATYNNPEEGITFSYPRSYILEQGEIKEDSQLLQRQDELPPGMEPVATLLVPDDAYPNTTFEHASLQLFVHENSTSEACMELNASSGGESPQRAMRNITMGGVAFSWSEQRSQATDTDIVERHYSGLANGACYEFVGIVAAARGGETETPERPVDTDKLLHNLEKILQSVHFHVPAGSSGSQPTAEPACSTGESCAGPNPALAMARL